MVDKSVKVEKPLIVAERLASSSGHGKSYLWPVLPALVFAIAISGVWVGDFRQAYEMPGLLMGLNLIFSVLVSLALAAVTGLGFLRSGAPALLFLGAGSIIWGLAGFVAGIVSHSHGVGGQQDTNLLITIHNVCVWISALCHLIGLSFIVRRRQPSWVLRVWLCSSYALALGIVGLVTQAAISGLFPIFLVPGLGGTVERQVLLGAAIVTFGLTGAILLTRRHVQRASFPYWYGVSLLLLAIGLFGVMLERTPGDVMSWTGRMSQFLGGAYMLVAALKSLGKPADQEYVTLRKGRVLWSKYLPKDSAPEEILIAIRRASAGERYLSPELSERLLKNSAGIGQKMPHERLSVREFEVMLLVSRGVPLTEIGERLHLSPKTITTYRARVLEKLGLKNNTEVTRYVLKHKIDHLSSDR